MPEVPEVEEKQAFLDPRANAQRLSLGYLSPVGYERSQQPAA